MLDGSDGVIDLGNVENEGSVRLEGCRAGGTTVFAVGKKKRILGAFATLSPTGPVSLRLVDIMQGRLSCRPGEATWTAVYFEGEDYRPSDVVVGRTRCNADGCKRSNARFVGLEPASPNLGGTWCTTSDRNAAKGDSVDVADLGDKTLLVWARADDEYIFGQRGGMVSIWMRLAPVDELERAPAQLLVAPDGALRSVVRVFARGDAAVVLVQRGEDQVAALRVDASGAVSQVPLTLP